MNRQQTFAGAVYGLVVHFRLYPIIYLPSFANYILRDIHTVREHRPKDMSLTSFLTILHELNWRSLFVFCVHSAVSFFALTLISYTFYGYQYLDASFFYHLRR